MLRAGGGADGSGGFCCGGGNGGFTCACDGSGGLLFDCGSGGGVGGGGVESSVRVENPPGDDTSCNIQTHNNKYMLD